MINHLLSNPAHSIIYSPLERWSDHCALAAYWSPASGAKGGAKGDGDEDDEFNGNNSDLFDEMMEEDEIDSEGLAGNGDGFPNRSKADIPAPGY